MKVHCEASLFSPCGRKGVETVRRYVLSYSYLLCLKHFIKYLQTYEPKSIINVWVCGSRTITDYGAVGEALSFLLPNPKNIVMRTGKAKGVDELAERWAQEHEYRLEESIVPDWKRHGKGAGKIRNTEGVRWARVVIAIWDGRSQGTQDCFEKAKTYEKPYEVIRVKEVCARCGSDNIDRQDPPDVYYRVCLTCGHTKTRLRPDLKPMKWG